MKIKKSKFFEQVINKKSKTNNTFILGLFIVLVFISPWFWIMTRNLVVSTPQKFKLLTINNELLKDRTNTLRGELLKENVPNTISKLVVNKFTIYSFEISHRYFETFDPQYLFFVGDLDLTNSTRSSGPLYLAFLPLTLVGIFTSLKLRRKAVLFLLLLTPVPASFIITHYETISRIPVFLVLTFFAAIGQVIFFKKRIVITFLLVALLIFEFFRFTHDFHYHYPRRLDESVLLR
jgi:hypothetical protein